MNRFKNVIIFCKATSSKMLRKYCFIHDKYSEGITMNDQQKWSKNSPPFPNGNFSFGCLEESNTNSVFT